MPEESFSWREYFLLIGLGLPMLLIMLRAGWYAMEENRVFLDKVAELSITGKVPLRFDTEYHKFSDSFTRPLWGAVLFSAPLALVIYFVLVAPSDGWLSLVGIGFVVWLCSRTYRACNDFWLPWRWTHS